MTENTWWNSDKSRRLSIHKCGSCGQKNVVGWQEHWVEDGGGPEGIRNQYGGWNWISGGYGGNPKILLCNSCLHFKDRIVELKRLQRTIDEIKKQLKEIHEATDLP